MVISNLRWMGFLNLKEQIPKAILGEIQIDI